jgi:ATP-dependent DNA ligase
LSSAFHSDSLHEIKYNGYRLRPKRDGDRVQLITRGDYNCTDRDPGGSQNLRGSDNIKDNLPALR